MHQYQEKVVQVPFQVDQLQRYIRYARTIRPRLTPEAAHLLIERYKSLRQSDASGIKNINK